MTVFLPGMALLLVGLVATKLLWRQPDDQPPAGWFEDPATTDPQQRRWDGQAWTSAVADGQVHDRGRRFHGRFWGWPIALGVIAVVATFLTGGLYSATESIPLLMVFSGLSMSLLVSAILWFVGRQQNWAEVLTGWHLSAVVVAGAGATYAIAMTLNDLVIEDLGLNWALVTVGVVEEGTKLVVPLVLFALGMYRNPRAGIAAGLASAGGFAIAEAVLYANTYPRGNSPDPCTGATLPAPSVAQVSTEQIGRILLTEWMHLVWTGIAVSIVWRLWRIYGRPRLTLAVAGGFLLAVVLHSSNDSSTRLACGDHALVDVRTLLTIAIPVGSYLLFKFFASQSTPPSALAHVSRGWHPSRLSSKR